MFRWLGLGVVVGGLMLGACGRQETGLEAPGAGSIQPGWMLIRNRVAGQLDFTNVEYWIVFNTSGNGIEPYPALLMSGFKNYNYACIIGGSASATQPLLRQFYLAPSVGLAAATIVLPVQDYIYIPNSGGNPQGGGEFTLEFDRRLMVEPNPLQPLVTPTATPAAQSVWAINFITTDPLNNPIDSMGLGGASDATFTQGVVNTAQSFDLTYTKPSGSSTVQNSSAQLQGFEIINAP
jgi:hypothetical protein